MLYSKAEKWNFETSPLNNPFFIPPDTDIVHFQWEHAIWDYINTDRESFIRNNFSGLFNYKREGKVKTIWTVHNALPHETTSVDSDIALMQKLSDESDIIHLLSKESLIELEKHIVIDREKVLIVPHSSYNGIFSVDGPGKEYLGIPLNSVVIGSVGKIRPYKNIKLLLDAYLTLKDQNDNAYLLIAGQSFDLSTEDAIKEAAKKDSHIFFIDKFLSNEEFSTLSNAVDIAVYPYYSMLNSGSVYSSATFGHIVFIPNLSNLQSLFELGFVYPFDSIKDLVGKLQTFLKMPDYRYYKNIAIEWGLANTGDKMSDDFFKGINDYLYKS